MLAVGPLGPQYWWLFAWYELGRQAHRGRRHSALEPTKLLFVYFSFFIFIFKWASTLQAYPRTDQKLRGIKKTFFLLLQFLIFMGTYTWQTCQRIGQNWQIIYIGWKKGPFHCLTFRWDMNTILSNWTWVVPWVV